MARTKKQPEEIAEELPEIDEPILEPPPIMVKTREYREYVAPMPIAKPAPQQQADGEVVAVVEEPEYLQSEGLYIEPEPPPIDPMEALLAEIGGAAHAWTMTIYRLPNFDRDGNGSLKARKILCGTQPFDSQFEETIQSLYARPDKPNNFLVCVRRDSRIHRILPVIAIEPVNGAERAATQQSQRDNAFPSAVVAAPVNPLAALKEHAEVFRELKKIFGDERPRQSEAIATVPNPAELTPESAMLKLLEVEPAKLEMVRSRIFGNGESSGGSEWVALVRELLPLFMPMLSGFAQRFAQPPQPNGQPQIQPIPQAPQQVEGQPPQEYLYLIGRVLEGIARGVKPELVAEEIDAAIEKDEQLAGLIGGIVDAPIDLIVSQLATLAPQAKQMLESPRAKMWLKELQDCFGEEESGDDAGANNGAQQ